MGARSGPSPSLELVVADLYEAALAPELWERALDRMGDLLGGTSFVFGYHDERGLVFGATNRLDPDRQALLLKEYAKPDTNLLLAAMPRLPVLEGVPRERLMTDEDYVRSGLYNDVFRPQGLTHAAVSCLQRGGGSIITCGLLRPTVREFGAEARATFARIVPHLRRSTELTVQNLDVSAAHRAAKAVGNAGADALLVVDDTGKVLFCNDRAARLLDEADGLCCRNGRVWPTAPQPQLRQRFADLVRGAAHRTDTQGGSLRIPRSGGALPLAALVMPVPHEASNLVTRPAASALVRLVDLDGKPSAPARRLADVFDLSDAEAALAVELLGGAQPDEVAERRGLKISTIRTQLRSLFAKTGTRRQPELVRLLAQLAGPDA